MIFFNFRADRAREITRALAIEGFGDFDVSDRPALARYVCLTEYDETFSLPVAFPQESLVNILAEVLSGAGLKQLRIAETEKYAHVTFFFNGGVEHAYPGEARVLIPSPRDVATYDLKPEMSAFGVRDRLLAEIGTGGHDCIVVNFANLDMVGHTGVMAAAEAAVRAVDTLRGGPRRRAAGARVRGAHHRRPRKRRADVGRVGGAAHDRPHDQPRPLPPRR